jgi:hypothetical protein
MTWSLLQISLNVDVPQALYRLLLELPIEDSKTLNDFLQRNLQEVLTVAVLMTSDGRIVAICFEETLSEVHSIKMLCIETK